MTLEYEEVYEIRDRQSVVSRLAGLSLSHLPAGGVGEVFACIRVAADAPAAVRRLGDEHPRAVCGGGVTGCGRDGARQFFHDAELLVPIQDPSGVSTWMRT
jgi:hypothetical protein